ncbi:NUDIX domain-containing protein [Sporosarcina sp. ACRSL]|uniref:NUDIX hydrolase n=1 Tax=Sporosarcina sp. ACRSL TaxID=2918215 RepID=UPI001EF65EBF|nr:NUDIX domain-containing protein [Sporosarcina sp. ACRSL]
MNNGERALPRAKVCGILQSGSKLLVEEFTGEHSKGNGTYYRLIGGSIEFGEKSNEALIREFNEEIRASVEIEKYVGCIENIFHIKGQTGHEIIQVYKVAFVNKENYFREWFEIQEGGQLSFAKWVDRKDFITGEKVLYPDGLVKSLKGEAHEPTANE